MTGGDARTAERGGPLVIVVSGSNIDINLHRRLLLEALEFELGYTA